MKNIVKIAALASFCAGLFAVPAKADSFSDFNDYIGATQALAKSRLKPFAEDFGGLIGGADFNSGRALGFPGFDVGLAATVQSKPNSDNFILKSADVKAFGLPLVQASVALPVIGADVTLRGIPLGDMKLVGAGVRYPVFKSGTLTMFIPDVAVSAFYDTISYDYFKGSHISLNAVASFNIPVVKPFVGFGYDKTTLEVKGMTGAATILNGVDATISKPRMTVGVKFSPLPLLYVYGAYSQLHGQAGYQGGLGARF